MLQDTNRVYLCIRQTDCQYGSGQSCNLSHSWNRRNLQILSHGWNPRNDNLRRKKDKKRNLHRLKCEKKLCKNDKYPPVTDKEKTTCSSIIHGGACKTWCVTGYQPVGDASGPGSDENTNPFNQQCDPTTEAILRVGDTDPTTIEGLSCEPKDCGFVYLQPGYDPFSMNPTDCLTAAEGGAIPAANGGPITATSQQAFSSETRKVMKQCTRK
jgi:hypothetical protein